MDAERRSVYLEAAEHWEQVADQSSRLGAVVAWNLQRQRAELWFEIADPQTEETKRQRLIDLVDATTTLVVAVTRRDMSRARARQN